MEQIEAYIDGRKLYVPTKFLTTYFQTDERNIRNWIKKGLDFERIQGIRSNLFIFSDVLTWHKENINKNKSNNAKNRVVEVRNDTVQEKEGLRTYDDSEAKEKHFKAELAEIKYLEAQGLLVDADDLDKAMAEQAVLHIADKTNDEKVLPVVLENKPAQEISNILHEHNQERIAMLHKIFNKVFNTNETIYDILIAVFDNLEYGVSPTDMINKIKVQ